MVALAIEAEWPSGPFEPKSTKAALRTWGNWYIKRTSHEFGWSSHYSCLNYFGLLIAEHKILFDTPSHIRFVDIAVGRVPQPLNDALALEYWWFRDLKTGAEITERRKAEVLGLESPSAFREVVRTARWVAQTAMNALDLRRESITMAQVAELSSVAS